MRACVCFTQNQIQGPSYIKQTLYTELHSQICLIEMDG